MKILRAVNRRGFSVGTAGWFTVLRPNTWFPASRLRSTLRGSGIQGKEIAVQVPGPDALSGSGIAGRSVQWLAMEPNLEGRDRMRSASVIFGAVAITSAMLWWIMHP